MSGLLASLPAINVPYVAPPGQYVWVVNAENMTANWTVPPGVTSISAVMVNAARTASAIQLKRGAAVLLSPFTALGNGVGGGNSGADGGSSDGQAPGGRGGAGGYTGPGGNGAYAQATPTPGQYYDASGSPGTGGGGGGGGVGSSGDGGWGGGVGLLGIGSNGNGGASGGFAGGNGSVPPAPTAYGAGGNNGGGNLRWKNDIPVTPGETLTLTGSGNTAYGMVGAVRIMWGGGRSFPSNALDV